MKKLFRSGLILGVFLGLILAPVIYAQKTEVIEIFADAKSAQMHAEKWETVLARARKIPPIYPFNLVRNTFAELEKMYLQLQKIPEIWSEMGRGKGIKTQLVREIFAVNREMGVSMQKIEKNLSRFPKFLLTKRQKSELEKAQKTLALAREWQAEIANLEKVFADSVADRAQIFVLLQNENEPRPTGGFGGSALRVNFSEPEIFWDFADIYALDRQVPEKSKFAAPEFFHNLSTKISLRDANFAPHFPDSAAQIRAFLGDSGEKVPETVIAINLQTARKLLEITGAIELEKWGITFDAENFDLALQFLVESKINGRFGAKQPVLLLAEKVVLQMLAKDPQIILESIWDEIPDFLASKNILAHSENADLQRLFTKIGFSGALERSNFSDNFLYFDFISVGANKSEKFVWTAIEHESEILPGRSKVKNTLKIVRNHAITSGEISQILGTEKWSQNVRDLLDETLIWKLGAGQNRTILRVLVPSEARILSWQNPSGEIEKVNFGEFGALIMPMFVSAGEKIEMEVEYETDFTSGKKGSYFLELVGTPARRQTRFTPKISAIGAKKFSVQKGNWGAPQPLLDAEFRAQVEF